MLFFTSIDFSVYSFYFISLLSLREIGKKWEREKHWWAAPAYALTGDQTCSLGTCPDRNWTSHLLAHGSELQPPSHTGQGSVYSDTFMLMTKVTFLSTEMHLISEGKVRSNFSKGSERWSKKHDRSANEHDIYSWETYLWAGKTGYLPDGDSVQSPVQDKKSVFIPKLQAENLTEGRFKAVELRDNHFCMNILGPKYESWRNWRCASQVPVTVTTLRFGSTITGPGCCYYGNDNFMSNKRNTLVTFPVLNRLLTCF